MKTKQEIAEKHGLPIHDPIQSYHYGNAMEEYAAELTKEKNEIINLMNNEITKHVTHLQSLHKAIRNALLAYSIYINSTGGPIEKRVNAEKLNDAMLKLGEA